MQFKYPELLWALFLLLIPILIHLFQLRRFKKTPFTNVKLLQRVVAESRRSSTLKKWLLLSTRLLLLLGLIVAFAEPFIASKTAFQPEENVIYLDDSFSMQAKKDNGSLLETAVQELIKNLPKETKFSLFTNDRVFKDITLKAIRNELLTLPYSASQLTLEGIVRKGQSLFSVDPVTRKNLILLSDFQDRVHGYPQDSISSIAISLVQLRPDKQDNISIDSAHISRSSPEILEITAQLSGEGGRESIPVSLYNGTELIAKTAANFEGMATASVVFTLPANQFVEGKIEVADGALTYDNQLYFTIENTAKINVLAIGDASGEFLERIFREPDIAFTTFRANDVNYRILDEQNLIILNELREIPNALQNTLRSFRENGGSLTLIPSATPDLPSYNNFLSGINGTAFSQKIGLELNITGIAFDHPLFQDVFEKRVTNFQYPMVKEHFRIRSPGAAILTLQDGDPFLTGGDGVYLFTAALDSANSNFKNSPLIVPTFYSMATNSLKLPELYHMLGKTEEIDIPVAMAKDNILTVAQQDYEFIPRQKYHANRTTLTFAEHPTQDGTYTVFENKIPVKHISFNYSREESKPVYLNLENLDAASRYQSITELFKKLENDNRVNELWKWFIILALLFVLCEVLIQKFIK